MTKSDFITAVTAKVQDIPEVAEAKNAATKKVATEYVNAMIECITETLAAKEKLTFTGFGTFEVRERAAREGVNPQTGDKLMIAATVVPAFKAGKALKDAVKA